MSLFRVTQDKLEPVAETTFAAESLLERKDLQRLLRRDISPVGDDLMVIAEEFGEWDDSSRRIDLLCLSKDASLVVVEIKRTQDGGHMELQAVRYAAMVSSMTLDQAVSAYVTLSGLEAAAARADVLAFLDLASAEEAELTGDVRIVLVSADFSTELTTAVLWLNKHDLDIRCVRLRPYRMGADVLVDATQIIPLPEAAEYEVRVREQEKEKKRVLTVRQETVRRFWAQLIERSKSLTPLLSGRTPSVDHWFDLGLGRTGVFLQLTLGQDLSKVQCMIRVGVAESRVAFETLKTQRSAIEGAFGSPLEWEAVDGRQVCRIWKELPGGWKSPEADWPVFQTQMLDVLLRLEAAVKSPVQQLSY